MISVWFVLLLRPRFIFQAGGKLKAESSSCIDCIVLRARLKCLPSSSAQQSSRCHPFHHLEIWRRRISGTGIHQFRLFLTSSLYTLRSKPTVFHLIVFGLACNLHVARTKQSSHTMLFSLVWHPTIMVLYMLISCSFLIVVLSPVDIKVFVICS